MPLGLTLNFYSISLGKLIIANINKAFFTTSLCIFSNVLLGHFDVSYFI